MDYFEDMKKEVGKSKIFLIFIAVLMIINVIQFKSLLTIASNKDITIEVPPFLEAGSYKIGSTFANEKIFKMWSKVWVEEFANYSYKDIRKRVNIIMEFLAPETIFKNKQKMLEFVNFVEENFITQKFIPNNYTFMELKKKGFYSITWTGKISRKIGSQEDGLSNSNYAYEFICYVRNGQVYIYNLNTYFIGNKSKLKNNSYINFDIKKIEETNKLKNKEKKEYNKMKKKKLSIEKEKKLEKGE
jgi:hypothetical protein